MFSVWKRTLLVWMHVVSSAGWMTMALALATLLLWARSTHNPAAVEMARVLDLELLRHLGTTSAFTGFMLAALTPWGYFRYWWVLIKTLISVSQLYIGAVVLSYQLDHERWPSPAGALLMASALAFQVWVSLSKPFKFTPWTTGPRRGKLPPPPGWHYLAALGVPVADYVLFKAPLLSLVVVLVYPVLRALRMRRSAQKANAT